MLDEDEIYLSCVCKDSMYLQIYVCHLASVLWFDEVEASLLGRYFPSMYW